MKPHQKSSKSKGLGGPSGRPSEVHGAVPAGPGHRLAPGVKREISNGADRVQDCVDHNPANGQWVLGNPGPRTHGLYVAQSAAFHADVRELAQQIITDLGGPSELSAVQLRAAGNLATVQITINQIVGFLASHGVMRVRGGAVRPAYQHFLIALDKFQRLATLVGLRRHARRVTPEDWLASLSHDHGQDQDHQGDHAVTADTVTPEAHQDQGP